MSSIVNVTEGADPMQLNAKGREFTDAGGELDLALGKIHTIIENLVNGGVTGEAATSLFNTYDSINVSLKSYAVKLQEIGSALISVANAHAEVNSAAQSSAQGGTQV